MNRTKHEFAPEEVMAYLDGELDASRAAQLAAHLERCDECGSAASQFRQLSERLLDFQVEAAPRNMEAEVASALESATHAKKDAPRQVDKLAWSKWRRLFRNPIAWGLATAAVIAVVVVVGVQQTGERGPATNEFNRLELSAGISRPSSVTAHSAARPLDKANSEMGPVASGQEDGAESTAGALSAPSPTGPMIAQTVSFTIVPANYDEASAAIDRLASAHGGYVQKLAAEARAGAPRELSVTLRVPATQLADSMAELRKLGHVEQETRANDEVTDQYVDLQARLRSARATEQRLLQLLATRTGKLEDVLSVEQELARIREEIESMDGQRAVLLHRVTYVTVDVSLREQYREQLHPEPTSTATNLHNSLVEGLRNLEEGVLSLLVFLFAYGPSILFWCALFLVPGFLVWRWRRRRSRG